MGTENVLKQYEIDVPTDDIKEAVEEIAKAMDINIDYEVLKKAILTENYYTEDNVCIFCDENESRNLIIVDCGGGDTFFTILVRCYGDICEKVKSKMLEVDTELRKTAFQESYDELLNTISNPESAINYITKRYKNLKIPGVNS